MSTAKSIVCSFFDHNLPKPRGSVVKWLGRRTLNPGFAGASPVLTTKLELFLGRP